MNYRIMGQPFPGLWNFDHHPWLRAMHDSGIVDDTELMVGQKSAQMGYTETVLNRVFYNIDSKGYSCLYVLPASKPDANDFSTSRFDPALESSTHLQSLFSDVKNIGHKRAGTSNMFIRGSKSRSQLKSVPVAHVVLDEVDEMIQENIPLVFERTSGQMDKMIDMISTPTIEAVGINYWYNQSSQDHFFFKCPHCTRMIELLFSDKDDSANCLIVTGDNINDMSLLDSHLICPKCKAKLDHQDKINFLKEGTWVTGVSDRGSRGFYINQLYSMTVPPHDLAKSFLRAQTNPADEQEFFNSKLGSVHEVEGARVTDQMLESCMGTHHKSDFSPPNSLITMGVDVGKWIHYEIDQWFLSGTGPDINLVSESRVVTEGKVLNFEDLDTLMGQYNVSFCVIDANPERRKALEFAQRFYGRVRMCFYAVGINSKHIHLHSEEECSLSVDRTSWLDLSFGRIKRNAITFPQDLSLEYRAHIKAPVRIYEKDRSGNPVGKYVNGTREDHFAHARCYAELALPLGAQLMGHTDIRDVV